MAHPGRGFVTQHEPGFYSPINEFNISSPTRWRTYIQSDIKITNDIKQSSSKCHIGPYSPTAGPKLLLIAQRVWVDGEPVKTFSHTTIFFEVELCRRLKFRW